jgi:site-specific DNA recombinase
MNEARMSSHDLRRLPEAAWSREALGLARAYERAVIRSRTRAALGAKRSRGERIGTVPFGYRVAADGVHLEPDAVEQDIMESVRELARQGLSQRTIVAHLGGRGVVGRKGTPLGQTQIARLLARKAS